MTHTIIATPIDGVVVARNVDVGQTVAASLQAPVLFVIANDLSRLQVSASIDEADVGRVRAGQEATFRVDAFPNEVFTGTVEQVRLQPITLQNVVTYTTIIGVNNPGQRLMPGMTATVSVIVDRRDDVLRIPAAALRFRPEGFDATAARPGRTAAPGGSGQPGRRSGRRRGGRRSAGGGRRRRAGARRRHHRRRRTDPRAVRRRAPGAAGTGRRSSSCSTRRRSRSPCASVPGITDGQFVEVVDGLTEGQQVVTGVASATARGAAPRAGASPAANPFAPAAPQRRTALTWPTPSSGSSTSRSPTPSATSPSTRCAGSRSTSRRGRSSP